MTKRVLEIHDVASNHWVGDGFPVRSLFPSRKLSFEQISPFLLLDYAGPQDFTPSERPRGVDEHPHRGFETVTIAYQGSVAHRDSGGHSGVVGPGDVQWMTAASGVVHEEKHEQEFTRRGGTFEMIQLWVNLPKQYKMSKPRYQTLLAADIPSIQLDKGVGRVIAGQWNGQTGPAKTFTPVNLFDIRLNPGGKAALNLTEGHTAAIFLLSGGVKINGATDLTGEAQLAVLDPTGEDVEIEALENSKLLVMSGEPIREPIAHHGPFVMNTREELAQAVEDFRAGRMGHLANHMG